jgi:serine/threonine protein phosphatase 1
MTFAQPLKKIITNFLKSITKPYPIPSLPDNTRIYCIGDIHGCDELLKQLTARIEEDAYGFVGRVIIIYLGDFIDRGNSSKEVIEFLLNNQKNHIEYVFLRGNHEQTLLNFLTEHSVARAWLSYGGMATFASYGVHITKIPTKPVDFQQLQKQFFDKLPHEHYQFLNKTVLCYSLGSYYFVHAGINPHYSLAKQIPEDLLQIRDDFISVKKPFEKIIVHGHTITVTPELLNNRIGIDTGAYMSGILTCLVLEADQQRLIQTTV